MSTIRRQSIISSGLIYIGIALGALNTFLYTRLLTPAQYGLIGLFLSVGTIMCYFAMLGMPSFVVKFYPYYQDNLPAKKNDMMSWALLVSLAGFAFTVMLGVIFKGLVIRKFSGQSPELVKYYYWIFPFALGLTLFPVLEAYGWQLKKSVLTNYLRDLQWRVINLVLVLLYLAGILGGFGGFLHLYAFNYLLIALILLVYLIRTGQLHFTFSVSRVTKKFFPKIASLALLAWSGSVVFNISFYFASIVIASVVPGGLTSVGIFTLAQYIGSLVQVPQRGIAAAAVSPLSRAWKDKDMDRIGRIYRRSSITQLVFSVGVFVLIWINFTDGVLTLHLPKDYLAARPVLLFIGLARITDMGTGVNAQVIGTSTYWRFDSISGMILVALTIPLNYILAKRIGIIGPAIADLITFSFYNGIRCLFLYRKFGMQPFSVRTLYTLLLGLAVFLLCHFAFSAYQGWLWLFVRSSVFLLLYASGVIALGLSEDIGPVWQTVKKRLGIRR